MTDSTETFNAPVGPRENHFDTDHLKPDLMKRSIRGGVVTFGAQAIKFVLNIISIMAMSRLLLPEETGIVTKVAPIAGFIAVFRDLGLSMATLQRDEINHDQVSSLFWINVAASVLLALVVAAISPLVGYFFGDIRTTWITLALATTFIFGGLAAQHTALLGRQMNFKALAAVDLISLFASTVSGIVAGWLGCGYWSLLVMQFMGGLANTVAVWIVCKWRPGRLKRGSGLRSMLALGGGVTINAVGHYIGDHCDKVMIGKWLGNDPAGLYGRAIGLLVTPVAQFTGPLFSVFTPALCRAANDPPRFEKIMLVATRLLLAVSTPMIVVIFLVPEAITLLAFGPNWMGVVPVFRPIAITLVAVPLHGLYYYALRASGNTRALITYGIFYAVVMPLGVGIGLMWGLVGVAYVYAIVDLVLRVPVHLTVTAWGARISAFNLTKPFGMFFVGLAFCAAGGWGGLQAVRAFPHPIVQVLGVTAGAVGIYGAWMLLSGQVRSLKKLVADVR